MTRAGVRGRPVAATVIMLAAIAPCAAEPVRQDAQEQYRIARRLVAERSPDAVAALRRAVAADPHGALADDARVDEALLGGAAAWPEEIGRLPAEAVRATVALLGGVLTDLPRADRAPEARWLRALARLEPVAGRDPAGARLDLVALATASAGEWAARARHALAWLDEREGQRARALRGYQRVVVDWPASPAAARARVGLGRHALRDGRFDEAALWLARALEADETRALGDLAVRRLLAGKRPPGVPAEAPVTVAVPVRSLAAMAATPGGGAWIAETRTGRVIELDRGGRTLGEWLAGADVAGLVVDAQGRAIAGAGNNLVRFDPGGRVTVIGTLGELGPPGALALDGGGTLWVADRRGQRVAVLRPGAGALAPVGEDRAWRIGGLVWDGRQLVALDARSGSLIAVDEGPGVRVLAPVLVRRARSMAADPSGRIAILDDKTGDLIWTQDGATLAVETAQDLGVRRAAAVALSADGALQVFDEEAGAWLRRP